MWKIANLTYFKELEFESAQGDAEIFNFNLKIIILFDLIISCGQQEASLASAESSKLFLRSNEILPTSILG